MARGRGEGTIVKRTDGRYQASLQVNGRRRTVYGRTRQEVAQKLKELQEWAERQGELPDSRRTVADLIRSWLETCEPTLKPKTLVSYKQTCDLYIRPVLGQMRLDRLKPHHVQKLVNDLQREDKTRTAQLVYVLLHRACRLGVMWGWLIENPCDRIVRPRYAPARKELWTPDQLRAFLEGTRDHWLYPLFLLAVATGARLGELLALTWEDVDLNAGTLTIRRSLHRIAGQWVVGEPKTSAGVRTIALPTEAVSALKRQRAIQAQLRLKAGASWQNSGLVFTGEHGQPLSQSTVQHALRRECQRLNLPPMTPHGLRHLHASLLLEAGLPVTQVSQRLGHATPQVTMSVYAHALRRPDHEAVEAIRSAIAAG
ncbi:MAG: site-specific integrase [Anaerolineae bacterium]|nr:site-specific integrase [Anaerolineae bacterium]